jgi:hypothetical protein
METALVVEGYRQRFFFPLLDGFFRRPLSEWTTVTMPYSRILEARHDSRVRIRLLMGLLFWSVPLFLFLQPAWMPGVASGWIFSAEDIRYFAGMFSLIALILTIYFCCIRLISREWLLYLEKDGGSALLLFHITSAKRRVEFEQTLAQNRASSRAQVEPVKAFPDNANAPPVPLVVLGVMLVGGWLGEAVRHLIWPPAFILLPPTGRGWWTHHLNEGAVNVMPILLLGCAIFFRTPIWRRFAALTVFLRGLIPLLLLREPTGPLPPLFVSFAFHLTLALVLLLTGPSRPKEIRS